MTIELRSISKRFADFQALDDVSLTVADGSLTALVGPSGSGKSTLLRVIAGLEIPDAGSVEISGVDETKASPQRRNVGFVFQHYAAFRHLTVAENVGFGLSIRKRPRAEIETRVGELLDLVQLHGLGERMPSQLSGGQRQRMALARALAVEPKVLLLDEPFGALDANVRAELREWLRRLHDEVHVTTVLVTHDQAEALEIASQLVVMNHGRIEQAAPPREIYEQPATPFVMGFVGPVSRFQDALVRPHDLQLHAGEVCGGNLATVGRVAHLGFEIRVDLTFADGSEVRAQLTRGEADELGVEPGRNLWVTADDDARSFADEPAAIGS